MQAKKKLCNACGELKYIWKNSEGNRYCKYCWQKKSSSEKPFKPTNRKPIALRSKKRASQDRVYSKLRKDYLQNNPTCQINVLNVCTTQSTDIHHSYAGANRSKYYLITPTWFSCCRACHDHVHANPQWARDKGYLK